MLQKIGDDYTVHRLAPGVFPDNPFRKIDRSACCHKIGLIFVPKPYMIGVMSLEDVTSRIKQKMAQAVGLSARVKFDFGDDGLIFVDNTQSPAVISHEDAEADTTLVCSIDTFQKILDGTQDPNIAFMMGKLKIKGSMGIAMKLNGILED